MDFGFSAEQEQLRSQVRRFLDSECPIERVRTISEADDAIDGALWRKTAELGWQALVVPEPYGGLGLKWEDLIVVAEECGRSLYPSALIPVAAAGRLIAALASEEQKQRWLPAMAAGELVVGIALLEETDLLEEAGVQLQARGSDGEVALKGTKMFVPYGQAADLLLVVAREAGGVAVYAVACPAPGVTVEPLELVDPTHRAARVVFDGAIVTATERLGEAGAGTWNAVREVIDAQTVAHCAEMVGAADAAVMLATDYAKVRKQFGHPIGRFQGVKHKLAELLVGVESARSLTYYASWAVDNTADATSSVSMAKAFASEALDRAGEECVQLHGAIGYTWECDAQLYYKRGRYCRNLLGSPALHHERVLEAQGL